MIISRTPLRISLAGGGTDVKSFYSANGGAVTSFTIDKFMYVSLNDKFDGMTRVSYSRTENVRHPQELEHELARECLRFFNVEGLEVTSVADIPGDGTGLGSSSAFVVGLLACLSKKTTGKVWPANQLAETAHTIESKFCGHPGIGKQDHYAAAYGGLRYYQFHRNDTVDVMAIPLMPAGEQQINDRLLLLYTGVARSAKPVLEDQAYNLKHNIASRQAGTKLRELAEGICQDLADRKFYKIGKYLDEGWTQKKHLSTEISNMELDRVYDKAIQAGASGGKLLGAGGGGFFLFCADEYFHDAIEKATGLRRVPFKMFQEGAKIIYDD